MEGDFTNTAPNTQKLWGFLYPRYPIQHTRANTDIRAPGLVPRLSCVLCLLHSVQLRKRFFIESTHLYAHDFVPPLSFLFVRSRTFDLLHSMVNKSFSNLNQVKQVTLYVSLTPVALTLKWLRGVPMDPKISFRALAKLLDAALPWLCLALPCASFGGKKIASTMRKFC